MVKTGFKYENEDWNKRLWKKLLRRKLNNEMSNFFGELFSSIASIA